MIRMTFAGGLLALALGTAAPMAMAQTTAPQDSQDQDEAAVARFCSNNFQSRVEQRQCVRQLLQGQGGQQDDQGTPMIIILMPQDNSV